MPMLRVATVIDTKGKSKTTSPVKNKCPTSSQQRSSQANSTVSTSTSQLSTQSKPEDSQTPFVKMDFEYICLYLEDPNNYIELFGSGSPTSVGTAKLTKAQAFSHFADYMNAHNGHLNLSGPRLRQRFDTYKAKYQKAKDFENNTGAGILNTKGYESLANKLEAIFPCFNQMDAIFGSKANISAGYLYDSSAELDIGEEMSQEQYDIENVDKSEIPPSQDLTAMPPELYSFMHKYSGLGASNDGQCHNSKSMFDEPTASPSEDHERQMDTQISSNDDTPTQSPTTNLSHLASVISPTQRSVFVGQVNRWQSMDDLSTTTLSLPLPTRSIAPNIHRASPSPLVITTNQKGSSLAGAFENANVEKSKLLSCQLAMDMKCYELERQEIQENQVESKQRFELDYEDKNRLYQLEVEARVDARQERLQDCEDRLVESQERLEEQRQREVERSERIKLVQQWLEQGKSPSQIHMLTQAMYGLGGLGF